MLDSMQIANQPDDEGIKNRNLLEVLFMPEDVLLFFSEVQSDHNCQARAGSRGECKQQCDLASILTGCEW